MQQVFLEVWQRGPDYDPRRGSPLAWVMAIARSRAIDHLRRRIPEPRDPAGAPDERPHGDFELDELLERWRLAALLGALPAQEADVLRRRFYEGRSQAEIAADTGVPLGTVKSRMVAGLARLREALDREEQARMSAPDPLITRLERLGPDEWRPEPPPPLVLPPRRAGDSEAPPRADAAAAAGPRRRPAPAGRSVPAVRLHRHRGATRSRAAALAARAADARRRRRQGRCELARAGGRATLAVSGLAPSRRGEFYELWLLSPPGDLVSLGSFRVAAGRPRDARGAGAGRPVPVPVRRRFGRAGRRRSVALLARPSCAAPPELGLTRAALRTEGESWSASSWRRRRGPTSRGWRTRRPSSPTRPAPPSRSSRSTASTSRHSPPPRAPSSGAGAGDRRRLRRAPRAAGVQADGRGPRRARGPGRAALRRGEGRRRDRLRRLDQGPRRPPRARQRAGRADPRARRPVLVITPARRRSARWPPPGEEGAGHLRHQADRRPRRRDGGEGHAAQARRRRARPDRARPRRDHRHRHLRDHRRGDRRLGPVDRARRSCSPASPARSRRSAFAELASAIPVSGSAYTYSYATLGELAAWIIGWDLILEYGVSVAAVAVGWGAVPQRAPRLAVRLRAARRRSPTRPGTAATSTCRPSFLVLAVTAVLMVGVRETARANTIMVFFKLAVLRCSSCSASPRSTPTTSRRSSRARARRGGDGRGADLLRLHRLRRGLDLERGGQEPAARPADRDHRLAGDRDRRSTSSSPSSPSGALPFDELKGRGAPLADRAERGRRLRLGRQHHLLRRARRDHERRR